ncbi:MAG: glutathione S-transferase family protein [Acidobacteriota bacterium]
MSDPQRSVGKEIVLYDLGPSPNNQKVRIALNYKGLPYRKIAVDPDDRSALVEASGQPLTPVMLHGDTVVYDSRSILRYLDSNFRDTPPLFSSDYATMQEIERLEKFARNQLAEPVVTMFRQAMSGSPDPGVCEQACKKFNEVAGELESRLQNQSWLVGDQMTAADVTAAPVVFLGMLPPEAGEKIDIVNFFRDNLELGAGREKTREWTMRVIAYDQR